ncbi:SDR family oxidoreductase [Sphingobacterium multivorum]|uniref:SDR family oxidoreductase n=1 Tax=Sphingobacterium thalpophilum TaxID=259 RepID=A0ACD5C2G0_9SPHI
MVVILTNVNTCQTFLTLALFTTDQSVRTLTRNAEPNEIAPSFLFLASEDSHFMSGQVLYPNGGEVVNG